VECVGRNVPKRIVGSCGLHRGALGASWAFLLLQALGCSSGDRRKPPILTFDESRAETELQSVILTKGDKCVLQS